MDAPILIWLYRESQEVSEKAGFNNTIFELKKTQSNESISIYQNKNPSE